MSRLISSPLWPSYQLNLPRAAAASAASRVSKLYEYTTRVAFFVLWVYLNFNSHVPLRLSSTATGGGYFHPLHDLRQGHGTEPLQRIRCCAADAPVLSHLILVRRVSFFLMYENDGFTPQSRRITVCCDWSRSLQLYNRRHTAFQEL